MSDTLTLYATRYLRNPDELVRSLDTPLLVFDPPVDESAATQVEGDDEYRYRTASGVRAPTLGVEEPLVFRVKKVADNAFKRGVTVGRTSNNDVVLDDGSVSRFHAWLIHEESGALDPHRFGQQERHLREWDRAQAQNTDAVGGACQAPLRPGGADVLLARRLRGAPEETSRPHVI